MEIIEYIHNREDFSKMGVRIPKGVLLYGPPGTGKTMIAKAAAAEANIGFISTSGSEFVEMFVGLGPLRIRQLFRSARNYGQPVIIFIDEIDAVGYKRGGMQNNREHENTLS